jgi:hypothetical protein
MEWTENFPEGSIDWDFSVDFSAESLDELCAATGRPLTDIVEDFRDYLASRALDAFADFLFAWRHTLPGDAGVPCAVCSRDHAVAPARAPIAGDE